MTMRVLVIGGTGVFGGYIVDELIKSPGDFSITVAGRRESAFKHRFIPLSHLKFTSLDLNDRLALAEALSQTDLVILAAGPFQAFSPHVALMAAERGVHYFDVCDDPAYVAELIRHREDFSRTRSILITGLSSLPGISLPLANLVIPQFDTVKNIDIGLFIGNKNQKGRGAVFSALDNLRRPVTFIRNKINLQVPAWSDPADYEYPQPIDKVRSYSFSSPDPLVFPLSHRFENLSVRVGFEWAPVRWSFSFFRALTTAGYSTAVKKMVDLFFPVFALVPGLGSERGCVSVTVTGKKDGHAKTLRASLIGHEKGQRMASLPCVIAAEALAAGEIRRAGLVKLDAWMAPAEFLRRLEQKGFQVLTEDLSI